MNKILAFSIIFLFPFSAFAQIELNFNQKDAIELPGNAIFDLTIEDVNNDSFPDYVYCDSNDVYLIDGLYLSQIATFTIEPGTELMRVGDLNNDGFGDVALCGTYPNNPDTNFALFVIGPNYDIEYRLEFPVEFEDWDETPSDIFFAHLYSQNLIFLGTLLEQSYYDPNYWWWRKEGRLIVYSFINAQFVEQEFFELGSSVKQIIPYRHSDSTYIILKAKGENAGDDGYQSYYNGWFDLISINNSFDTTQIWYVGGNSDLDRIPVLEISSPQPGENDLIFFISHPSNIALSSLVCFDDPYGNVAWQKYGYDCTWCDYNLSISNILNRVHKDLFIFRIGWLDFIQIRNPYDGYLNDIGEVSGYRGNYYCSLDQENDDIDEFFFIESDSLFIFNLQIQTAIDSDNLHVPEDMLLSISAIYPNPFNSMTTINFELSELAQTTIEIYDLLGRQILILTDQDYQPGHHQIIWNAEDIKSGVYFVRASTPIASKTMKIVLLK